MDFEAQRQRAHREKIESRWRLALVIFRISLILGALIYINATPLKFSTTQVCSFFLIYVAAGAWPAHQASEKIIRLQAEIDRLKSKESIRD
ncbi:hypothetical protein [Oleiharenicola lentus]|uniref:hypothetical protein n=1 Tax=Oleiharenicola lentus TaxID=2508720 RepID=UPI003F67AF7F